MSGLKTTVDDSVNAQEQAYLNAVTGLNLQYPNDKKAYQNEQEYQNAMQEYQRQMQAFNQGYSQNLEGSKGNIMKDSLDIIGEAYQKELGANAAEKLQNALSQSLTSGIDPINWTVADAEKFLGVQNLSEEGANAIGRMLSGINEVIKPLNIDGKVKTNLEPETDANLTEKVQNILSAQELTAEISGQINADWEVSEIGDPGEEILALVSPDGQYTVPFSVLADVGWTVSGDMLNPALLSPDSTLRVPISAEAAVQWKNTETSSAFPFSHIPQITTPMEVKTPVVATPVIENSSSVDTADLTSQIPAVTEPVETAVPVNVNVEYNNVVPFDSAVLDLGGPFSAAAQVNLTTDYQSNPFLGRALDDFSIQDAYEFPTVSAVTPSYPVSPKFAGDKGVFGIKDLYTTNTTVKVQVHYATQKDPLPNLTGSIRQARGGIIGKNGVTGFAAGGMVRGGAQLVTVAEEGTPEMIIPLGAQRRERGLYLWEKAGRMLNVPHFATGGIVGTPRTNTESIRQKVGDAPQSSSTSAPITVTVGNITIQIEANGENKDLLSSIENQKEEIANIIGGAIREALADAFINTPALGGKTA